MRSSLVIILIYNTKIACTFLHFEFQQFALLAESVSDDQS